MFSALDAHAFVAGRFESTRLNSASAIRSRPLQQADGLQDSGIGPRLPHAGAGNMGIHRSVFEAVGGFDAELGCLEDTDFCWRVQLAGVPLVFWPDAVAPRAVALDAAPDVGAGPRVRRRHRGAGAPVRGDQRRRPAPGRLPRGR